ncbi:MAG: hypothetical protein JXC85_01700 [Candidatus Aenigmarchaeota archaeon]|nr:hypothetical protein [Candidatus Aenigmarchaeota archaeon]
MAGNVKKEHLAVFIILATMIPAFYIHYNSPEMVVTRFVEFFNSGNLEGLRSVMADKYSNAALSEEVEKSMTSLVIVSFIETTYKDPAHAVVWANVTGTDIPKNYPEYQLSAFDLERVNGTWKIYNIRNTPQTDDFPELVYCEEDGDCIQVSESCCGITGWSPGISINVKYKDWWEERMSSGCGKTIVCPLGIREFQNKIQCVNNECKIIPLEKEG